MHRNSYQIEHDGRTFYYGKQDRADGRATQVHRGGRAHLTEPGDRLFVGPATCARRRTATRTSTTCSPSSSPATHYIEMDPGVANAEGSGLADELASSDIAILSTIWDDWDEPNDSRKIGSAEAERVLARALLPRRHVPRIATSSTDECR